MKFDTFCRTHAVTNQERIRLARYLAVLRMEQTLKLQEATHDH